VMGPAASDNTSETLQFPKLNGTNFSVWSDNMKAALQAKSLWGVVSGRELCPPKLPTDYPELMTMSCPSDGQPSRSVQKEGQELIYYSLKDTLFGNSLMTDMNDGLIRTMRPLD
ncbi:hypothetical protein C0993_008972, partial [Termitomyces sp. T159_Od127]